MALLYTNHIFYVIALRTHSLTLVIVFWWHEVNFHCEMKTTFTRCSKIVYHITQIFSRISQIDIFSSPGVFNQLYFYIQCIIIYHTINFLWLIMVCSVFFNINLRPFRRFWPFYRLSRWCSLDFFWYILIIYFLNYVLCDNSKLDK